MTTIGYDKPLYILHSALRSPRLVPNEDVRLEGYSDGRGANVLVAGSSIFGGNETVPEAMNRLRAGRE
jgi:hypothetical protein